MKTVSMKWLDPYAEAEKKQILQYLLSFVSENKRHKFIQALQFRTRHITIVLEDIYQPHNASAVLRSCDCFGIQDVHIIENKNRYEVNPEVALGSAKWLTLVKYNQEKFNTEACITGLKAQGYEIIATRPKPHGFTPDSLPLANKVALLFGTELEGLSPDALRLADKFIHIPMVGFTESLNISVSAAILLQSLTRRLHLSSIQWNLSEEEKTTLLLYWVSSVVKKPELLIHRLMGNR